MKKTDTPGVAPGPGERKLTVSEVRVRPTHAEVTFFETAAAKRKAVLVQFSPPNNEVIANVREA